MKDDAIPFMEYYQGYEFLAKSMIFLSFFYEGMH